MSDKNILLSISMLISGKDDMEKSLASLHYFKDAFPCEVILVDTGCNAEQRALAERYGDKILDFVWCNDFAAARNAGLKEARGEWFLYLDDDEWFENPREIISFFQSGEYKNYNCASYVVRNYDDIRGTMYDDSYPSRMVKLEPETKFVGKIHEYLEPFRLPKKTFSDYVHHYGYAYQNEEEREKHAQRNIGPLLEMRKEHPGNPRWICQLAQEYFSVRQYEEVINACKKGLNEWNTLKEYIEYAPSHIGAVYAYILISMETLKHYEEEEKWLKKAFKEPLMKMEIMEPTVAFYCLVGARLYSNTKDYGQCRQYFKRYMDYYHKRKNDRTMLENGAAAVVAEVFQERSLYGVILMSIGSVIRMEDHDLVEEAFYSMDWSDRRLLHQNKWEKSILEACCSVAYHPLWVKLLQTLVSREDGMKEMYVVFLETEIMYKQEGETEKLSRLHRLAAELEFQHIYILSTKILWAEEDPQVVSREERRRRLEELFDQLGRDYFSELFEVRTEVWNVAERAGISLEPMLLQADFRCWKQMLEEWSVNVELSDLQKWDRMIALWKRQPDIRYDLFAVKCLEGYLRHYQEAGISLLQVEELLWKYADNVLAFNRRLFQENVFLEIPEALPEEVQLALQLKELQHYREQGDDKGALSQLRKCLGICSLVEPTINEYARWYRDEVQQRSKEAEQEQTEFRQLVDSLKTAARLQIENKNFQDAKEILLQVQQCVPDDQEVRELLAGIGER